MNLSMCEVIVYQEHYPKIDDVEAVLKGRETVKKYIIVLHDKDVEENGNPKKSHYHIYLHFGRSQNTDMCCEWFQVQSNAIEKIKGSRWSGAELYAVHENKPEAYQYDPNAVRANYDYIKALAKASKAYKQKNLPQTLASAILSGQMTYRQAYRDLLKYDYSKEATRYLKDAYYIYSRNLPPNRNIDVVFFTGQPGAGKTDIAKAMATAECKDYYISESGADPMGDYMGEQVLILDDVREDTFTLVEWLKLLDNHTNSGIRSRYSNKFFSGDTIYITSAYNPMFWFLNTGENRDQFFRRINQYIVVTFDKVFQYNGFKVSNSGYVEPKGEAVCYNNPVPMWHPKNVPKDGTYNESASKFTKAFTKAVEMKQNEIQSQMKEITDIKELEK